MNISDIIQLVIFCALIFFPLGYYALKNPLMIYK